MDTNSTNLLVRSCKESDLDEIKLITAEAFNGVSIDQIIERSFGEVNGENWQARKLRDIHKDVLTNLDGVFVCEIQNTLIGYVTTNIDVTSRIGRINNIAIASGFRGKGYGRQLINHAIDFLKNAGMAYVRIETLETNEIGYSLYTAMGFKELVRQVHFIKPLE